MIRRSLLSALVALALLGAAGCNVYRGMEIEGQVVDAVTKQPIPGAIVAVNWQIYGGLVHGSTIGSLHVAEAVTDAAGRFALAAWGPKTVLRDGLNSGTPILIVAHPNYYFQMRAHKIEGSHVPPMFSIETRACNCEEKLIEMEPLNGDWVRYGDNAEAAERNLPLRWSGPGLRCVWEKAPQFAKELLARSALLTNKKISHALPSATTLRSQPGCSGDEMRGEQQ